MSGMSDSILGKKIGDYILDNNVEASPQGQTASLSHWSLSPLEFHAEYVWRSPRIGVPLFSKQICVAKEAYRLDLGLYDISILEP